jgi:hypothetical protein
MAWVDHQRTLEVCSGRIHLAQCLQSHSAIVNMRSHSGLQRQCFSESPQSLRGIAQL